VALLDGSGAVANLATSTVGPNATTPAGSVFPTRGLPVAGVGAAAAAAIIVPWYRRRRRLATATS
jgi:NADH:ubiquinone oxidoreductase subunit K